MIYPGLLFIIIYIHFFMNIFHELILAYINRVSEDNETKGLDQAEHGENGYTLN